MPYDVHSGGSPDFAFDVTHSSAVLQSRIHVRDWINGGQFWDGRNGGDLPAATGKLQIEVATDQAFTNIVDASSVFSVGTSEDGIARWEVTGLSPRTTYYWRHLRAADTEFVAGPVRSFRTAYEPDYDSPQNEEVKLAFVSCPAYEMFMGGYGTGARGRVGGSGAFANEPTELGELGLPIWRSIRRIDPVSVSLTGDTVYFRGDGHPVDTTVAAKRTRWHRGLSSRWLIQLLGSRGSVFQADDWDIAGNDAEPTDTGFADGLALWDQQLHAGSTGYRSIRWGNHAEFFYIDVRRYRDESAGTLLGATQLAWLKAALLASPARFKIIVSPTPWNGPDHSDKSDNHCHTAYKGERDAFVSWATTNGLLGTGANDPLIVICGDRHKLYYTISPDGLHEFCCGAANVENAQSIPIPGDPDSTDPSGLMTQSFSRDDVGGFVLLSLKTVVASGVKKCQLTVDMYDEMGTRLSTTSLINRKRNL
jgi:alkaline phosphatase D